MEKQTFIEAFGMLHPADASLYGAEREAWDRLAGDSGQAGLVREIREEGDRLLGGPIPPLTRELFDLYRTQGTRLEYESVYFERRRRLTTFGLLRLLYPQDERYAAALRAIVREVLAETTWCLPAHMTGETAERGIDLFASETGFALAELLVLSGDRLEPELRADIRAQVDRRLFTPYLTMGPYHWETAEHNWAAVCAGSIGAAALLLEPDAKRLAVIIGKAMKSMDCYLAGFGEDGACLEGLGYWNYGFGYYVYFADLLHRRTGGAIDLLAGAKTREIALFQQRCYLMGDLTANFSDAAPDTPARLGLSAYLAARYDDVEMPPASIRAAYTEDHCARFAPALRELLWYRPDAHADLMSVAAAWPDGSRYLADAQWLVSRHAGPAGRFGFAAKGGHNAEPHNHIDVGHFIVLAEGEPAFAADLGRGEYTSAYFGEGRYAYDCNGAQGHSLPVVGGRMQQAGRDRAAVVLRHDVSPEADLLELELAGAYDAPTLASLVRRLVWDKTELPVLELRDVFSFEGDGGRDVEEVIVTRCEPRQVESGCLLLKGSKYNVRLEYDGELLAPTVERRTFAGHFGEEQHYYRIGLKTAPVDEAKTLEIALRLRFDAAGRE
ncbi:hypothetical protein [Cohnella sp. 56]|uniref:hypothetical protein n=1 Tax=Cohnella sp. 56 TaxID=3113722 RepID=UPI0030E77CD5